MYWLPDIRMLLQYLYNYCNHARYC